METRRLAQTNGMTTLAQSAQLLHVISQERVRKERVSQERAHQAKQRRALALAPPTPFNHKTSKCDRCKSDHHTLILLSMGQQTLKKKQADKQGLN